MEEPRVSQEAGNTLNHPSPSEDHWFIRLSVSLTSLFLFTELLLGHQNKRKKREGRGSDSN